MASQDNPELGLCHNPSADKLIPPPSMKKSRKGYPSMNKVTNGSAVSNVERKNSAPGKPIARNNSTPGTPPGSRSPSNENISTGVQSTTSKEEETPAISLLDEPTTTDHRSFVQNVFGTVAFKMVEWLAPRNVEVISRPGATVSEISGEGPYAGPIPFSETASSNSAKSAEGEAAENPKTTKRQTPIPSKLQDKPSLGLESASKPVSSGPHVNEVLPPTEPKAVANSVTKCTPKINGRRKSEHAEPPNPKGILNLPSRIGESPPDIMSLPQYRPHQAIRKLSTPHQTLITSAAMHAPSIPKTVSMKASPEFDQPPVTSGISITAEQGPKIKKKPVKKSINHKTLPELPPAKEISLPQSLSLLPIDLLNFLCDTLQIDGTSEKHDLMPTEVGRDSTRWLNSNSPYAAGRKSFSKTKSVYSSQGKHQWKDFIQQALFDVLSKPESLIQSFSHCDQRLYDTQTIWYLMLRLTRVAPSLVLDSLWNAAGYLFNPPDTISSLHDWKESDAVAKPSLSSGEAARLINICLHALVATAPLLTDARQLANMSRIRSFGLAMLGRETSSLEPVQLCLAYEDAFTNDLAMRLARRLFASIPTRRRFAELADNQQGMKPDGKKEPDVLEGVLSTLKFLDLGTTPALHFHDEERDLHEKRVPTLLLDWARTVMLQDWNGSAEVAAEGSFGGALAMMAAICKSRTVAQYSFLTFLRQAPEILAARRHSL
jgi:hypothetical protein